ncbi:MAG: response regulator [Nitrospiraceae bacterium]
MMRKHVLIVDDDAALLSLLKMRLKKTGHTVDTAETGWDGLSKLEHANYDVVLLDSMMPGLTGLTVLQHIQARRPTIPVVMMTGHTSSQVVAQALAGGARACLVKPVDPVELDQALRCWVRTASSELSQQATRNEIETNEPRGGSMSISFANCRETKTNQGLRRDQ